MLNAGKIRLMTDLAIYEKKNGDTVFKVNNFYKSDYIVGGLISAFARYTFCGILCLCFTVLFRTDVFFARINAEGVSKVFTEIGILYAAGLILYLLIAYSIYSSRYKRAKRGALLYATKLKRLGRRYCGQESAAMEREAERSAAPAPRQEAPGRSRRR